MIRVAEYRNRYIFYLFILIAFLLFGCQTTEVGPEKQGSTFFLSQDLNSLQNSNGKIVNAQLLRVGSAWSANVECYRIAYLSDGLKVIGFVLKPKGGEPKYPAIIFNRGGNREFGKITKKMLSYLSYLSSHNYVVLASQYRGSDGGQGREEFGGKDINDVLNLIETAKSLPFIDSAKIVMLGFSRGGMMTYLAIKHGAQIRAAAVVGGITDLNQLYNEREEAMKRVIRELVGMDEKEWMNRSAYYWPEKLNTPILMLHGEDDWRVSVSQARKLSEKFTKAGKRHKLFVFPKGDHLLSTHSSERNRKIFDWFEEYLNH